MKLKSIILTATTLIALSIPTSVSAQSLEECVAASDDILIIIDETDIPEECSSFKAEFVAAKAQESSTQNVEPTASELLQSVIEGLEKLSREIDVQIKKDIAEQAEKVRIEAIYKKGLVY